MKKLKLILIVLLLALFLSSCSKDNRTPYQVKMDIIADSLDKVTEVNVSASMTDSNFCVYTLQKDIYITQAEDNTISGYTQTNISSLGEDFQMVERTDNENFSGTKPESLFGFKLDESKLSNLEITDTELKANIASTVCNDVLNALNFQASSDVALSIKFEGEALQSWSINFTNATNKVVSIEAQYKY